MPEGTTELLNGDDQELPYKFWGRKKERIKKTLSEIGLSTKNLDVVRGVNHKISHVVCGFIGKPSRIARLEQVKDDNAVGISTYKNNYELVIYEPHFSNLSQGEQRAVLAHELAHANSPFKIDHNSNPYSADNSPTSEQSIIIDIAEQSIKTGVYLNSYHKDLAKRYLSKRRGISRGSDVVTQDIFYEETWAILVQLRFSNPDHLRNVQEEQRLKINNDSEFQDLVSVVDDKEFKGIDLYLKDILTFKVSSVRELDAKIKPAKNVHPNVKEDSIWE